MGKKADLEKQIVKLSEKISKGDYKEKVPIKVQEQDAEKVGSGNGNVVGYWMTNTYQVFPLNHSYDRAKLNLKR